MTSIGGVSGNGLIATILIYLYQEEILNRSSGFCTYVQRSQAVDS